MRTCTRRALLRGLAALPWLALFPVIQGCDGERNACVDLAGMTASEERMRSAVGYTDVSPFGEDKQCSGCSCQIDLINPPLPPPRPNMLGDAVLIEPRPLRRLPLVLSNARSVLPHNTWMVHFWHGPNNVETVLNQPELQKCQVKWTMFFSF